MVSDGGRQQVRAADPRRRLAAAAAEDRAQRHGGRGRPGHAVEPRRSRRDATIPLASTQPQVNPDEFLASLDADTQSFLKLLLANGAEALDPAKGRDVKLSNALRRLEPFARDIARISGALADAPRRTSPARSTTSSSCRPSSANQRPGPGRTSSTPPTPCSPPSPREQASIRGAVRELPGTLKETKGALTSSNALALQSGPALKKSLPGAKATGAGPARAAPLLPADRRPDREPDPAVHHAGGEPGDPPGADLAGPRRRRRPA